MILLGLLLVSAALFLVWQRHRLQVSQTDVGLSRGAGLQWFSGIFWAAGCIVLAKVHWIAAVFAAALSLVVWRMMEGLAYDRMIARELYKLFDRASEYQHGHSSSLFAEVLRTRYPSMPPETLKAILEESTDFEDIVAHAIGYERSNGRLPNISGPEG